MVGQGKAKNIDPVLSILGAISHNARPDAACQITGITYDSRDVEAGFAFCCIPGEHVNGNQFILEALKNGASAIFSEEPLALQPEIERQISNIEADGQQTIYYFQVPDVRLALALIADHFYDYPSQKLRPIGITGTNGKTTTTHIVEHILQFAGYKVGLIGTLGARWTGFAEFQSTKHTSPQASDLHRVLAQMVDAGCTHVAMEVSSHALVQHRVAGCHFAQACLTNITQDHLDYHQTMEHYWQAKRRLYEMLNHTNQVNKTAIVNMDDVMAKHFLEAVNQDIRQYEYSWDSHTDFYLKSVQFGFAGTQLTLATPAGDVDLKMRLTGRFNVYNVIAAVAVCVSEGVDLETIQEALVEFPGVPGRFEVVSLDTSDHPLCIVDYAHTPDGLDNVIRTARNLTPDDGQLIVVFGCGGDRDTSKRPLMGELAESNADKVIITSDNPRTEDPQQIIANILAGIKRLNKVTVEPDRASAIRLAVEAAGKRDVVLVAGKGHENYQILADKTIPFDDRTEVRLALSQKAAGKLQQAHNKP